MATQYKQLYRSKDDRMIAGVCGGIGDYLDIDPTIIRLVFAFGAIITGSALFWVYIVMMFVVPEEKLASQTVVDVPAEPEVETEEE